MAMSACAQWCKNLGSYGGLVQGLWQFYAVEQDVVQGRAGGGGVISYAQCSIFGSAQ